MKNIPLLDLQAEYEYMKADVDAALGRCIEHQKWIFGPEVKELEDKIAEYLKVKHCIGVSSGTEALVLSLRALAIKTKGEEYFNREDEIITSPFTFTATGDAILRSGATPVFVDIDPVTYNIDSNEIKKYVASNSKSKVIGIVPVHLYGLSCNMDEIIAIAKEYSLSIVEDAAQAFGGMWKGNKLGSIGTAGAFSFFPSKNLGGFGDGGMVSTNDDEMAELVRMLLKHGGKDKYNVDHVGYNARLDTIQAAVLLAKFKYIDEFNERRRKIAEMYSTGLSQLESLFLPNGYEQSAMNKKLSDVYLQYTVRTTRRDELQVFLKGKDISTMVYYPVPLHKMRVFEGMMRIHENLNVSEKASSEVLSLPMEPLQDKKTTDYIINQIKSFYEE